jgi:outer membrane receptor for ferrienterochelin and colicins
MEENDSKRLATALSLALALAVPSAVSADAGNAAAADQAKLDTYKLDDTVVTATRTGVDRKKLSTATEVITRQQIEEQGAENLAEALRYATGVQLTHNASAPGHKAVSIRGFDSRFSTILVDGRRVSAEVDQNYELDRIPLDNIERIEIVRGPMSAVHGTEAMGGVINIITRRSSKPALSISADAGFWSDAGKNGSRRYGFAMDTGNIGKFSLRLNGFKRETKTAFFKRNGTTYEPYGTWKSFGGTLEYRPTTHETWQFMHSDTTEDTTEYFYPTAKLLGRGLDLVERHDNALSYEYKGDKGQDLFLRYYRTVMDKDRDNYNSKTGALVSPKSWVRARRTINAYEGQYTWQAGEAHKLTVGGEYRPEEFRGTAVTKGKGDFTAYGPKGLAQRGSTYHFYYRAAYAEDEWKLDDRWQAFLSLRYDGCNVFNGSVSPKLGLTYAMDDKTRLKFNIGRGFRMPTPNQLYQSNVAQKGNPDLKSETAFSYDLSLEKDWQKQSAKLTFFDNRVHDYIDLVTTDAAKGWKEYRNIDSAIIRGVEAEYRREVLPQLFWHTSWTWLDAQDATKHTRLENRARNMLTSGLTWQAPRGLTADLEAQVYGAYLANPGGNKSFALWNLTLSQKLADRLTLRLAADNLLNKKDEDMDLPGLYLKTSLQYAF